MKNFQLLNEMKLQKQVELEDFVIENQNNLYPSSGIYVIYCLANQKHYIGKSKNILSRLKSHRSALIKGTHNNKGLQRAFIKYGSESFLCCSLQKVEEENLSNAEGHFIKYFNSLKTGFNRKKEGIN